jgi:hypothetical protein
MLPGSLRVLVTASQFHIGLVIGAVLSVGTALLLSDRRSRPVAPVGGLLVAVGFAAGIAYAFTLPVSLALGVALLAMAGFAAERIRIPAITRPFLAFPGAIVLAAGLGSRPLWVALVAVLAIACASPLVSDFDRRYASSGWPLVLYAISVVGVYFTVPDTERVLVLLGVTLPLAFVGWPVPFISLGPAGGYAVVGVLIWVGAFESRGRESAFIGAIACLALLVMEPLARVFGARRHTITEMLGNGWWAVVPVALVQFILVYIASRIAGLQSTVSAAIVIVGFETIAAVAVLRTTWTPLRS